jgi:hypothetical protein
MSDFIRKYFSERFPLPSKEKVDLGEKHADITCDIRKCISIIDDFVNTYVYDVSIENLSILGQIMSTGSKIPPIFPFSILTDTLLNNKTNHTPEEKKKEIMNKLFVLEEGDETTRNELVRPIKLNIIDVLFNESFFDDLQRNTTKNYTPEEKECLKSCLKVELEDINNNLTRSKLIRFIPEFLSVSLTGANGVITTLIKELGDRMKRKLMIHQSINRINVEQEKKNKQALIKQEKALERIERLAKINEEREIREEEHEELMKNDEEYRNRIEQREKEKKASDLFRKQQFNYEIKKSNKEDRIRRLAKKYNEEYNQAIIDIKTDYVLDTRITDEDLRKNNEERINREINDFINKENSYLEEIRTNNNIAEPINSDKVKAYAYAHAHGANIDVYEKEFKGGKSKKTYKNRKGKKCRKTNKKQKKKSLGYRKNKGRKTRRIN